MIETYGSMWTWCLPHFFLNDTATTEIYTLSLHDALPISELHAHRRVEHRSSGCRRVQATSAALRSEEHTSELQSLAYLVCRLMLENNKDQVEVNQCATDSHADRGLDGIEQCA